MTFNEYQQLQMRTAPKDMSPDQYLENAALGMCGESGEVADLVKKCFFQGHTIDMAHLKGELGDVLWYVSLAAHSCGATLEEIAERNIEKLRKRYPEGFDVERSIHRAEGDM